MITFHAEAEGFPTEITWQWQGSPTGELWEDLTDGSGSLYSGVNTDTLVVNVVDTSLNGWWYRGVASNVFLTATSGSAQLIITNGTGS